MSSSKRSRLSKFSVDSSGKLKNTKLSKKEIKVIKPFDLKEKYLILFGIIGFGIANLLVFFNFKSLFPQLANSFATEEKIIYVVLLMILTTFSLLILTISYALFFLLKAFIWKYRMKN